MNKISKMKIAIIGTGNVGGTLAIAFHKAGHQVILGVRSPKSFSGMDKLLAAGLRPERIGEAVRLSEVIVLAVPATAAVDAARELGDTSGKIIIDTMNIVAGRGPAGYSSTAEAVLDHTQTDDVVKCFNTTGYENMQNPSYTDGPLDMFVAGDSERGKDVAAELARAIGFGEVFDLGGNDKFQLIEHLANVWIDLAIFQGYGRDYGFRFTRRSV